MNYSKKICLIAYCMALNGCAYDMGRPWVADPPDAIGPEGQPVTSTSMARFPDDIRACVAANEPKKLADLDRGEGYRFTGWLVDDEGTTATRRCMKDRGWIALGSTVFFNWSGAGSRHL